MDLVSAIVEPSASIRCIEQEKYEEMRKATPTTCYCAVQFFSFSTLRVKIGKH